MNTKGVEVLNLGLMLVSLLVAFVFPFHLFLLTYAVLGPIHYITEIHWLNERNYFIKDKKWMWYLASITLLIALPPVLFIPILSEIKAIPIVFEMMNFVRDYTDIILLATFFFAIGLIYF